MIKSVMIVVKHLIYGGTEKYTLNLANSLVERGISVTVVTSGGPLAEHLSPKINVFYTPISRRIRDKKMSEKKILKIAERVKPDIIHTQCRTAMVCSQLAREDLNIPLVTHEHHMYDEIDYPIIVDELKFNADKIITIGPYTSKKLLKYGIRKDKVVTVINGVDTNEILPVNKEEREHYRKLFGLKDSDKVVVCLSRIVKGKGIDKLVSGFLKISEKIPNTKLILAGDDDEGDTKPEVEKVIKANNLQNKIFIFPGEYNIRKFHSVADVFCYPALCKGMSVMEAMAAGLPVVGKKTTRKPLTVENGISGLMTESTAQFKIDPQEIADKISYLLKNPKLASKMGQAARVRIVEKYNLTKTIKKVLNVYSQTLSDHKLYSQTQYKPLSINNKPLFP